MAGNDSHTAPAQRTRRPRWHSVVQMAAGLAILAYLFHIVPFADLWGALRRTRLVVLLAAILVSQAGVVCRAERLRWVVHHPDIRLGFIDAWFITLVGIAISAIVPSAGGDVLRSYYGYRRTGVREQMLSGAVVDKLIGMQVMFLVGAVASCWLQQWALAGFSALVTAAVTAVVFRPQIVPWRLLSRVTSWIRIRLNPELLSGGADLSRAALGMTLLLSLAGWAATFISTWLLFRSVGAPTPLLTILAYVPVVTVMRMAPVSPDGMGTQEAGFVLFLGSAGGNAAALAVSLLSRLCNTYAPAAVGAVLLLLARGDAGRTPDGD